MNTTTDTTYLEDLLSAECRCESRHQYTERCSGEVTYVLIDCRTALKVCAETIDDPLTGTRVRMERRGCVECHRPASECWTIRPI